MFKFHIENSLDKLNTALRWAELDEDDAKFTFDPETDRFVLWELDWENPFGDDMVVINQFASFQEAWEAITLEGCDPNDH